MSAVDWSSGLFFLESAVDVTGGTNYIVVSTSQFMSVPYALYAKESPLDTTLVQNMIDSSVLNIDSTLIASWGYIDSNSIMILINNNSLDSTTIQNMIDNSIVNIDSSTVASWGYLDSSTTQILINNSAIDSSSVSNWGYLDSVSIQNMINNSSLNVDSTMIANFGFVAGPHTIDTDTQLDSTGIAALGYIAGPHTIDTDTQIDSAGIAGYGYVAGPHTIDTDTDTQLDSVGVAALGYVAGPKTIDTDTDTQLDSTGIAALGYVVGPKTIDTDTDTQLDSAGIASFGYLDSVSIRNMMNQYSSKLLSESGTGEGNSFIFPEGYNGIPITHYFGNGSYTVPTGKSLYVTIRYSTSGDLKINNTTVSSGTNNYGGGSLGLLLPLILNSGDILSSTISNSSFHGFLLDENLSSITHSFGLGNYTVPSDKTLYLLNRYSPSGDLKINNTTVSEGTNNYGGGSAGLLLPVVVSAGDVVSSTNSSTSFNGYLAPIDYFSSSSSSGSNANTLIYTTNGF